MSFRILWTGEPSDGHCVRFNPERKKSVCSLLKYDEILLRAKEAEKLSSPCRLCPRACGIDRTKGERGYCGAGPEPSVAAALPHFGEEPPLTGSGGAGTIFFGRCNLRCLYCQNHQISQGDLGRVLSPDELALEILRLAEERVLNHRACFPDPSPARFAQGPCHRGGTGAGSACGL